MAGGKFSEANLFGMTIRESANDGSDFTNPDADYRRLFLGEDGLLHLKDSAGTVTTPSSGVADQGTVTYFDFTTAAAPSSPAAGKIRVYSKTGDTLAQKTSGGTETIFGAGGGSGVTQSFVGYNTAGGTWETLTTKRAYWKSITLAATSTFQSIDIYLRPSTDNIGGVHVMIAADNSTAPGTLLAANSSPAGGIYLSNSASMPGAARWLSIPIGATLAAATYWLGFMSDVAVYDVAYDGSGTDQYFTSSLFVATGAYPSAWAITTGTRKYSIRASILS